MANKPAKIDLLQGDFRIDACNIRNDSPTCSKEGFCIAMAITVANH